MGQVWTFDGAPTSTVQVSGQVTLLEGTTFCICETSGDIRPGGSQGLFVRDTRLISKLELSINGHVPEPLYPETRRLISDRERSMNASIVQVRGFRQIRSRKLPRIREPYGVCETSG